MVHRRALMMTAAGVLLALTTGVAAQSYPSKPVRLIIPFPPGGSNDVVGRMIATKLSERLGKQVVVDNRSGAGGVIGTEVTANAAPDGYTLGMISIAHAVNPWLYKLTYDPIKSFAPVAVLATGPNVLAVNPGLGINAGTAAVQSLFGQLFPVEIWRGVADENGFYRVYEILFGNPFTRGPDPLLTEGLQQPELQLPFESGRTWSFTGGPHSGWGNWAAWAALDFAPPGEPLGCVLSNEWVVGVADGLIVRSADGEVVQDLDGDGLEGTGWVIQYLHIETRDRIPVGARPRAGDRIGHPSCEGGISSGTHLHISRKYNGEWISADGAYPFVMDGWVSAGSGSPYDGTLSRDGINLEACSCRFSINQISR